MLWYSYTPSGINCCCSMHERGQEWVYFAVFQIIIKKQKTLHEVESVQALRSLTLWAWGWEYNICIFAFRFLQLHDFLSLCCFIINYSNRRKLTQDTIPSSNDISSICRNDKSSNRRAFGCFSKTNDGWKATYIRRNRFRSIRLPTNGETLHAFNNHKDIKHLGGFRNVKIIFESRKCGLDSVHWIHLSNSIFSDR